MSTSQQTWNLEAAGGLFSNDTIIMVTLEAIGDRRPGAAATVSPVFVTMARWVVIFFKEGEKNCQKSSYTKKTILFCEYRISLNNVFP